MDAFGFSARHEGPGPIFQWTEAQFPGGLLREVSGLKVSSFYRLLAMSSNSGFFDYIGQTSCQDGLIATQRQVGRVVLQNLFLG